MASPAKIESLTIGGRTFTDLAGLKVLYGGLESTNNFTFREAFASSGYQVSGGTFDLLGMVVINRISAGTIGADFGYSDNDVGMDSGTALTNGVFITGNTSGLGFSSVPVFPSSGQSEIAFLDASIPDTKYITVDGNQTTNAFFCVLYGIQN